MSCKENLCTSYFDGTFHVLKYPTGSKLYRGSRVGREFPIGEEFYKPVDTHTPLPPGYKEALEDTDQPLSETFSEFFKGKQDVGWYSDPFLVSDPLSVSAYVLVKDAVFIDIEKSEDTVKFIQPAIAQSASERKKSGFLRWLCKGVDNDMYAGYTTGMDRELIFCNSLAYLKRDLKNEVDWQHFVESKEQVVQKYLDQLKLYKTPNVNIFSGNPYEQTVWTVLHLEEMLATPGEYIVLTERQKSLLMAAALVVNVGSIDPERSYPRRYDFLLPSRHRNLKLGEDYLLGRENVPAYKNPGPGQALVVEKLKFSMKTVLSKLGVVTREDTLDINNLVKAHWVLSELINLYTKDPPKAVDLYVAKVNEIVALTSHDSTFFYSLLSLSVATIRAMQPPSDPQERSVTFPFIKNVPKKFRGGLVPPSIDNTRFVEEILSKLPKHPVVVPLTTTPPNILQEGQMWFKDRMFIGDAISDKIENIEVSKWKRCLSGENAEEFKNGTGSLFRNTKIIGKGTYGQVYLSSIDLGPGRPRQNIVIKEALLTAKEKERMETSPQKKGGFIQNSWPDEFKILSLTKNLLVGKKNPNFLDLYHLSACEGCSIKTLTGAHTGTCYTTFMEAAHGDLTSLPSKNLAQAGVQLSFLYQMLIAVHILQKEYGMVHRDIKRVNIFYQKTPQLKNKFFKYVIGGRDFYVENRGFVFYLADFGVATMCKPEFALTDFLGERNGIVVRKEGQQTELEPLTSKYLYFKAEKGLKKMDSPPLLWEDGQTGTRNVVSKIHDPEFVTPVDLSNTQVFPSWQFNGDIQDVLMVVAGGKHSVQKGNHKGFGVVPPTVRRLINPFITNKKYYELVWDRNMSHQVLADEMLKKIYTQPASGIEILDTFMVD